MGVGEAPGDADGLGGAGVGAGVGVALTRTTPVGVIAYKEELESNLIYLKLTKVITVPEAWNSTAVTTPLLTEKEYQSEYPKLVLAVLTPPQPSI